MADGSITSAPHLHTAEMDLLDINIIAGHGGVVPKSTTHQYV